MAIGVSLRWVAVLVALAVTSVACDPGLNGSGLLSGAEFDQASSSGFATSSAVEPRPDWLGTVVLPSTGLGYGEIQPTPLELIDRRFATIDVLPPPVDEAFRSTVGPVPADVLARSTWRPGCPVAVADLSYLTVSHWGFDERVHTGELIVHRTVADDMVKVFGVLHASRFPIETLKVVSVDEMNAWFDRPTGDMNESGAFECRPATGSTSWSRHAYGLAIDINPFHNPYLKGEVVLPELASAYLDRSRDLPGMITNRDVVVEAFASIGWSWGGNWNSLKDWMHFSSNGR